jgi:hypothetical protein
MIAAFKFHDLNHNVVADHQGGSPIIRVSVSIELQPILADVLALIDTGSNVTLVQQDVVKDFVSVGKTTIQTGAGAISADQYAGTVTILDLKDTVGAVITAQPIKHKVIIGRDVLQHYRMIYDPLKPEFSLEKPATVGSR